MTEENTEKNKEENNCGSCCSGCSPCGPQEEVDVESLGPEAVELAEMFDKVDKQLMDALKTREEILAKIYKRCSESQDMKDKIDKVLKSRNPMILGFVLGQAQE